MEDQETECIVLVPKSKTANSTTLLLERRLNKVANDNNNGGKNNVHVAGGEHHGIIVYKTLSHENTEVISNPDISLQFRVFLKNAQTGAHTQESRTLRFWFKPDVLACEHSTIAQHLFKDVVCPADFPKDYVGFIRKIMKLMQIQYVTIKKIEIELRQLEGIVDMPQRPLSGDESMLDRSLELTEKKLLDVIESSYPNPVTVPELSARYSWEEEAIKNHLNELQNKGLVKALDHGAFTRVTYDDIKVKIVKQMPTIISAKQPTFAIITAQYCEKVAVDALIEDKETYVRYTTLGDNDSLSNSEYKNNGHITEKTIFTTRFGESNVYTLGNIGSHRVVCTKLPTVGHTREAMIAAGNTTTRLLGTFQKVDYVILVGVGGGVPHYTDYQKHVRLGDVVVSHPADAKKYVYTYCEKATHNPARGTYEFETKDYCPTDTLLQEIAYKLKTQHDAKPGDSKWLRFLSEGEKSLQIENGQDFSRPSIDSDKLYMCIGEGAIIEVAHPVAPDQDERHENIPRIHVGPIASGRAVSRDEQLRQAFALYTSALAFDSEFDSVIESVIGSCRESFAIVRGIADYRDGTKRSEWQPFASMTAAAVVKAMICAMEVSNT
ncbi:hypothetical protein V9T40_004095 [Parthenolecanium corni]|uniref:Winged helix-turn-helix domain-containing protein n=1 Tax=Parthenolecanium corni TaxID=536013 RepID=A0AAN9Y3C6_9HEMI